MSYIVYINDQLIEISDSKEIVYNKQCNDISELANRQSNFTYKFNAPLTANNKRALGFVGSVGNGSNIPYQKNNVQVIDSDTGLHLIKSGWAVINETNKNYEINTYDGVIDLFKAIEGKTFGNDIDLIEIDHEKNLTTVIDSFTNEDYRYIIGDYGGKTHLDSGVNINIDYLVPSVRYKYLWNKIFTTFGFNYIGNIFDTFDFDQLWLTYPKGINNNQGGTLYAEFLKDTTHLTANINLNAQWDSYNIINGYQIGNWKYVVIENGTYKIESQIFALNSYFKVFSTFTVENELSKYTIQINGVSQGIFNYGELKTLTLELNIGDVVNVFFVYEPSITALIGTPLNSYYDTLPYKRTYFSFDDKDSFLNIYKFDTVISFTDELKQLSLTEFLKETLWRFGLTIFIDENNNYIFKTFDERLQSDVVDWSAKYSKRTNESYIPKSYGQANNFLQNYNDKEAVYNNGTFSISNENLDNKKDLLKSKFFSPEKDFTIFYINSGYNEVVYPTLLWQKEVSENSGTQEVKYKELANRFYLLRSETILQDAELKSETLGVSDTVTSLPVARFLLTTFKDFIPKYYSNIDLLLNDFKMHKIEMLVNTIDFVNLDLDKIYYFEQEQNYYFLNKMQWQKGKLTNADFYRVKYSENINNSFNLEITNITVTDEIQFTEIIPYTKFQIVLEINGLQYSAIYENPLTGYSLTSGDIIRFLDIDTNQQISNYFTV